MNVLHVNQDLSVKGGGVARMIREFAPYLDRLGAQVYAATAERVEYTPKGINEHIFLPAVRESRGNEANWLSATEDVLAGRDIDVVHVHEVQNTNLVSYLVDRVPTVVHLHNYNYWCPGNDLFYAATDEICPLSLGWKCVPNAYLKRCNNRHPKRLYRSILNTAKKKALYERNVRFVVSSNYMRDRAVRAGVPAEKIDIVSYAVDKLRFDIEDTPLLSSLEPGYVLFVGRLAQSKGVRYLMDAFAGLQDTAGQLVIVGDGQHRDNVESYVRKKGLRGRVHLLGWQSGAALSSLYNHCRVLVVPSVWDEVFGIVGLEAMAAHKPVVAFDVGGISQWLEDGVTGFLVPRKDATALAEKISLLLENPELAQRMGEAGYERFVQNFTVERQARRLMDVYRLAIKDF